MATRRRRGRKMPIVYQQMGPQLWQWMEESQGGLIEVESMSLQSLKLLLMVTTYQVAVLDSWVLLLTDFAVGSALLAPRLITLTSFTAGKSET